MLSGSIDNLRGTSTRSEWAQIRKRNHPLPSFLETSRIDGVKAPLHNGTPRSHDFGTASAPRSRSHAVQIRTVSLVVPIRKFARRPDLHSFARSPDPQHRFVSTLEVPICTRRVTYLKQEPAPNRSRPSSRPSALLDAVALGPSCRRRTPRIPVKHLFGEL